MSIYSIMSSLIRLSIGKQVLIFAILGFIFGIFIKYNLDFATSIGITPDRVKILGELFLRLVKMSIVPLVFCSITSSVLSISDSSKISKIGLRALFIALITSVISVLLGLLIGYVVKPGVGINIVNQHGSHVISGKNTGTLDSIINIIPHNIIDAMQKPDLLQIIFFSIFFGLCINGISKKEINTKPLSSIFSILTDVCYEMIRRIMYIAPIAIFSFISWIIITQNFAMIKSMIMLIMCCIICTIIMVTIFYPSVIFFVYKLNPIYFLRKIIPVQILASATTSSAAALPLNMEISIDKIGTSKDVANFTMPIGATCNMNGCAFSIALYIVFTIQIYGINIDIEKIPQIILLCILGAIGTPPVHGGMLIMVSGILTTLNYPIEIIGILLTIDKISATFRVIANVTGNAFMAMITDISLKSFNKDIYNGNKD